MDNTSLSFVSTLMFMKVPDSALQTEVLFSKTDLALVEAVGTFHGFWRGLCLSLPGEVNLEIDFPPFDTWVMVSD